MEIRMENISATKIAFIRTIGPYGLRNVGTMEALKKWASSNRLFDANSIILGIARDNPGQTKPEDCRYDTCLVIEKELQTNDERIRFGKIVEGKYAIATIPHTTQAVQNAWQTIFHALSTHGYQFDSSRPILERYKVKLVSNHQCEICVPVK